MTFVHLFHDNFSDNLVFLSFYWSKTMERKKGRERIRISCEYERKSCTKVVTKWLYKYHFSKPNIIVGPTRKVGCFWDLMVKLFGENRKSMMMKFLCKPSRIALTSDELVLVLWSHITSVT